MYIFKFLQDLILNVYKVRPAEKETGILLFAFK